MLGNHFGTLFKIVTWGESHGIAIGVVIEGCPAGLELCDDDVNKELELRRPGTTPHTSQRHELDHASVLSGVFEGKTTGAPISILIENQDAKCEAYTTLKDMLRPGHANYTYLQKYGVFDWRGGGRASARETATRVAAGAVAKKLLQAHGIDLAAYVKQIGECCMQDIDFLDPEEIRIQRGSLFCPDSIAEKKMEELLTKTEEDGDSVGGVVELITSKLPVGLGEPLFQRVESTLASAMLSIPASKGIEFGAGFNAASMKGSEHNDLFAMENGEVVTETNNAGGVLGGLTTGMPLRLRVVFKPTSSIKKPQETLTLSGAKTTVIQPSIARHDPCVAVRATIVCEAMAALVLADFLLMSRCSKLHP